MNEEETPIAMTPLLRSLLFLALLATAPSVLLAVRHDSMIECPFLVLFAEAFGWGALLLSFAPRLPRPPKNHAVKGRW